jgi:hypothetical protein
MAAATELEVTAVQLTWFSSACPSFHVRPQAWLEAS